MILGIWEQCMLEYCNDNLRGEVGFGSKVLRLRAHI